MKQTIICNSCRTKIVISSVTTHLGRELELSQEDVKEGYCFDCGKQHTLCLEDSEEPNVLSEE